MPRATEVFCVEIYFRKHTFYVGESVHRSEINSLKYKNIALQCKPSTPGAGKAGTRLAKMAAFPRCSSKLSFPHRCLTASSSSCPVCLASAALITCY